MWEEIEKQVSELEKQFGVDVVNEALEAILKRKQIEAYEAAKLSNRE